MQDWDELHYVYKTQFKCILDSVNIRPAELEKKNMGFSISQNNI